MPLPVPAGKPPIAPPDAASVGAGNGGPTPAPMTTPQPMQGMEKAARVKMQVLAKAIQGEIPNFPFDSKEAKTLVEVLKKLADTFGKSAEDDQGQMKSETLSMLGMLGGRPPGGAPPGAGGKPPMPPPAAGAPPAAPM